MICLHNPQIVIALGFISIELYSYLINHIQSLYHIVFYLLYFITKINVAVKLYHLFTNEFKVMIRYTN